tara:strand:+ start:2293 stop:2583 length:291 start_codon:yes stop_codon:yes gene_type:complete
MFVAGTRGYLLSALQFGPGTFSRQDIEGCFLAGFEKPVVEFHQQKQGVPFLLGEVTGFAKRVQGRIYPGQPTRPMFQFVVTVVNYHTVDQKIMEGA